VTEAARRNPGRETEGGSYEKDGSAWEMLYPGALDLPCYHSSAIYGGSIRGR